MKRSIGKFNKKYLIAGIVSLICLAGGFTGASIKYKNQTQEGDKITTTEITAEYKIELSETQVETILETEDGNIEVIQAPTVEMVDSNNIACDEGEECGKGKYIYAPIDTPWEFRDYTLGQCLDLDSHYGAQCWDLMAVFQQNYTGRDLSTCGSGGAKGVWLCKEYNAGNEYDLIYDPTQLQAGDMVVFNGGQWGHIGMALGGYNNGYVALLGQNQGGASCVGGGQATNIINISLKDFAGALRPKIYEKPNPTPTPEPIPVTGCSEWDVLEGHTMSLIMLTCEGGVVYGDAMDAYAKTWYSRYYKPNQSVYDGWHSETGVGLYAGDTIDHKTD